MIISLHSDERHCNDMIFLQAGCTSTRGLQSGTGAGSYLLGSRQCQLNQKNLSFSIESDEYSHMSTCIYVTRFVPAGHLFGPDTVVLLDMILLLTDNRKSSAQETNSKTKTCYVFTFQRDESNHISTAEVCKHAWVYFRK